MSRSESTVERLELRHLGWHWSDVSPHGARNGEWNLLRLNGKSAATVWPNGVWHTWDEDGVGGENSSAGNVFIALRAAEDSAIEQGFIAAAAGGKE